MTYQVQSHRPAGRVRSDLWEFRLLFAATFLVMLVSTVVSRLIPVHSHDAEPRGSIFREAAARADRIVPFMFMG